MRSWLPRRPAGLLGVVPSVCPPGGSGTPVAVGGPASPIRSSGGSARDHRAVGDTPLLRAAVFVLLTFAINGPLFAHKVLTSAWTEGKAILGGIGYICGVFGLAFFVSGHRRLKAESRARIDQAVT